MLPNASPTVLDAGAAAPSSLEPARLTIISSATGARITKRWFLNEAGKPDKNPGGHIAEGQYEVREIRNLNDLEATVSSLKPSQVLVHGVPTNGTVAGLIATDGAVKAGAPGIARSLEYFGWPDGPGIMMFDVDLKEVPPALLPTSVEAVRDTIVSAVPALATAPMLGRPSSSANLRNAATGADLSPLTGARLYVLVERAADIPELGKRMVQRLKLADKAFPHISQAGVTRVRTLLDASVWSPEREDFATAEYVEPVVQAAAPALRWNEGAAPVSLEQVPPVSLAEVEQIAAIEVKLKASVARKAAVVRDAYVSDRRVAGFVVSATSDGAIEHLDGDHTVKLKGGAPITVDEIVRADKKYHRAFCADPLEPEYSGGDDRIAQIFVNDNGSVVINSNAHGGIRYFLKQSATEEFGVVATGTSEPAEPPVSKLQKELEGLNTEIALVRNCAHAVLFTYPDRHELLPIDHARTLLRKRTSTIEVENARGNSSSRKLYLFDEWLEWKARREFGALISDPTQPRGAVENKHGGHDYNTWSGFATMPSENGSFSLFNDHLLQNVCGGDAEQHRWVLIWLASAVQHPERLPGTALVLHSDEEGAGKTVVFDVMRTLLGKDHTAALSSIDELTARFNTWRENLVLATLEESLFGGDHRLNGKLKHAITHPSVRIEHKGLTAYELPNFARFMFTSNEKHMLPVGKFARRFMILNVAANRFNDLTYWTALRRQMFDEGGCARFMRYLQDVEIDWAFIARPLPTAALRDQQLRSLDIEDRWLLDLLTDATLPGDDRGDGIAPAAALRASYEQFARANGARRVSAEALGRSLRPYALRKKHVNRRPDAVGPRREYAYFFEPLTKCRDTFARALAVPPDWDSDEAWQPADPLYERDEKPVDGKIIGAIGGRAQ